MNPLFAIYGVQVFFENIERNLVFDQAKQASIDSGKPLLNAGCGAIKIIGGFSRAIYESDVNLDISPRDVPNFCLASIESIPYTDNYFGAVFCAHTLQHVDNWQLVVDELNRVAGKVFLITPKAIWLSSWIHPNHKRVFAGNKVVEVR